MPGIDYRVGWWQGLEQGHHRWTSREAALKQMERLKEQRPTRRYRLEERDVTDLELLARTFQPREDKNDG